MYTHEIVLDDISVHYGGHSGVFGRFVRLYVLVDKLGASLLKNQAMDKFTAASVESNSGPSIGDVQDVIENTAEKPPLRARCIDRWCYQRRADQNANDGGAFAEVH